MAQKPRIPRNLTVAELNKLQPGQGTSAQKARIARLLANPGTRSLLADRFLSPAQQAVRTEHTRLAEPVVPGSSMTVKDLETQANAATALKYGPAETQAGRDLASRQAAIGQTSGFFDNYLAELRAHEANQQQINAQSQAAMQGLAGSVQGLAQGDAQQVTQGNQGLQAATGVAPASVTQDASNASMLRQALTASFGSMLAGQGASAQGYADTLAHVVGPGQKVQGLTRAQGDVTRAQQAITDLASQKGSFRQQFENEFKQNEAKNVLAAQIATGKSALEQQKIDLAAKIAMGKATASTPAAKGAATAATEEAKQATKYGMSVHQWRLLGPNGRAKVIAKSKSQGKGPGVITSGAFAGYTQTEVAKMDPAKKQQLIDSYNKAVHPGKKPKPGQAGGGPDWKPSAAQSTARSQVVSLRDYAAKARSGQPFVAGHTPQPRMSRAEAATKIKESVAAPADPILLTAALDAAYDGRLSRATVRALIAAGYKPSLIASALHVGTGPTPRPGQGNPNIPSGKI